MVAYATTEIPAHQPTTLILITGDGDFTEAVATLKWLKHTVVVIGSTALSSRLASSASKLFHWKADVIRYAQVDRDVQLNCISIGMIGLTFGEESDTHSSPEPGQKCGWSGDAQILIPRSFKILIRFVRSLRDERRSMVHIATLQEHLSRASDWQKDYLDFNNYVQHAMDLDIVQLLRFSDSGSLYLRLNKPQWWDDFD